MRRVFILVPSLSPTGPVKGAVALANALAVEREVRLVALKPGPGVNAPLNPTVAVEVLGGGLWTSAAAYRRLLTQAGGRHRVASISFCLSADMVNLTARRLAVTCASVRGNLLRNYRYDYGRVGVSLAIAHLTALRGLDHVTAMTLTMARQIAPLCGRKPAVIGNFVDEAALEPYRAPICPHGPWRLAFVGSLTPRKQAHLVVRAAGALLRSGRDVRVDLIGDGPLRAQLAAEIGALGLAGRATLHGHLTAPWPVLAQADAMVLPSLSEGMSRAVLEALYLGIPCVLRDIDGNAEVVRPGVNGSLFRDESGLAAAIEQTVTAARAADRSRPSLLPTFCRQARAARRLLALVETARTGPAEVAHG